MANPRRTTTRARYVILHHQFRVRTRWGVESFSGPWCVAIRDTLHPRPTSPAMTKPELSILAVDMGLYSRDGSNSAVITMTPHYFSATPAIC